MVRIKLIEIVVTLQFLPCWANLLIDFFHLSDTTWKMSAQTSLGVQWIGICLPMQGTWISEDSTRLGATKPVVLEDSTRLGATKPVGHCYGACVLQLLKPKCLEPMHRGTKPPQWEALTPQLESSPCSPQLEKVQAKQWGPSAAKNRYTNKNF